MKTLSPAAASRTHSAGATVTVNGERRELTGEATIASLLAELGLDARLVVVEHNREIVRDRDTFGVRGISAGDVVEIVHFVGGG